MCMIQLPLILNWLIIKQREKSTKQGLYAWKCSFGPFWCIFDLFFGNSDPILCKNCPGYQTFCSAGQVHAFGYTIRQLFIDCVLEIPTSAHFEYLRFLFLPLEWNNFWMAGPIISRRRPVDLSEKTLYFRHQFFVFISKNVWVMG